MKDLNCVSVAELQTFFGSFDYVLSDVDGVLWNYLKKIPGTQEALKSLKKIGKKVILVSNNTTKTLEFFLGQLRRAGFELDDDELVTPIHSTIDFLKKQNLEDREIFLIGMTPLREALEAAGFKIAPNSYDRVKETIDGFARKALVDDGSVGVVIADCDLNLTYLNLQKAAIFLRRPEVIFMKGPTDCHLPLGKTEHLMGPGYFIKDLEDETGRQGIPMAKPSPFLHTYIMEKYNIRDTSRVLFIGDSIPLDMSFATECKYKKLLVLTGTTKKEDLTEWKFPEEYRPDYYADSLKVIHDCIKRVFNSNL